MNSYLDVPNNFYIPETLLSLCGKELKFTVHPYLKWLTFPQSKDEPKVKAVRVNGHFTEVKQPALRLILRWVTI